MPGSVLSFRSRNAKPATKLAANLPLTVKRHAHVPDIL
jgi:hypothetical protein